MIRVFDTPTGGKTAIDMTRVEAITCEDNQVVLVTPNDVYKVAISFDEAVKIWRKQE